MRPDIPWRANDGIPLWPPERNRNHVAGHEVGAPHPEVEAFGDDVDQTSFSDEIDMHLWVAAQELHDKRRKDLAGCHGKGVDAQRT
jgi:hypothetical protein